MEMSTPWQRWARPIIAFAIAAIINFALHEIAHAAAAQALGLDWRLFQHYVTVVSHTDAQRAIAAATGPVFSLVFGSCCWIARRRGAHKPRELLLLYLGAIGIAIFLGNVTATALGGDGNAIANALRVPRQWQLGVSFIGATLLVIFLFVVGKNLHAWAPPHFSRVRSALETVAIPVLFGTALVAILYQPMSLADTARRLGEAATWFPAVIGALTATSAGPQRKPLIPTRSDYALLIVVAILVRVMATGISI